MTALFYGCKQTILLGIALEEMGLHQPYTIVTTDNITKKGLKLETMQPKASKSMDMQWHWLNCRAAPNQFHYQWKQGSDNHADYYRKHHAGSYHQQI